MRKNKQITDFNMGNIFTYIFGLLLSVYFCYLTIEPVIYKKQNGVFISYNEMKSKETEYYSSKTKGYKKIVKEYTTYEYLYQYTIDGLKVNGTKYSRMVIFPNAKFDVGDVPVYVNRMNSNKSILVPVTLKYWLINNIPFFIYWIVILVKRIYKKLENKLVQ